MTNNIEVLRGLVAKWRNRIPADKGDIYHSALRDAYEVAADELEAALAAMGGQGGWRPIETAPEGDLVLVYDYRSKKYSVGGVYKFTYATHWMPLPPPPGGKVGG